MAAPMNLGASVPSRPTSEDIDTLAFVCGNLGAIAAILIDVACNRDPHLQPEKAKRILAGLGITIGRPDSASS